MTWMSKCLKCHILSSEFFLFAKSAAIFLGCHRKSAKWEKHCAHWLLWASNIGEHVMFYNIFRKTIHLGVESKMSRDMSHGVILKKLRFFKRVQTSVSPKKIFSNKNLHMILNPKNLEIWKHASFLIIK